eukprot:TRINITY_DN35973_c0_g1_i1.p1 TRINITY_DN35973_c0_g1~~TRINITY_DN35973_c0_g1_i1.p1  ORF type:complete len:213 (-),score=28.76 TRINITY_DN35973_c0_g1_i1:572-1210(-)
MVSMALTHIPALIFLADSPHGGWGCGPFESTDAVPVLRHYGYSTSMRPSARPQFQGPISGSRLDCHRSQRNERQRRAPQRARAAADAGEPQQEETPVPIINIKFKSHKVGEAERDLSVESGTVQLRKFMAAEKLPLYDAYGMLMNCGGAGNCGTCLVEILKGGELLSERTAAEEKGLKNKPANWRLACQTIVGDKSNSGQVLVQCLPQKVKR